MKKSRLLWWEIANMRYGGENMENYFYKCEVCGFVYLVPAYWVSYEPEAVVELEHMDLKTGGNCACQLLKLLQDEI